MRGSSLRVNEGLGGVHGSDSGVTGWILVTDWRRLNARSATFSCLGSGGALRGSEKDSLKFKSKSFLENKPAAAGERVCMSDGCSMTQKEDWSPARLARVLTFDRPSVESQALMTMYNVQCGGS